MGTAVAIGESILVGDVLQDSRYANVVPGSRSELVVPLRRKKRAIGAINLLSPEVALYTERDEAILRQFGAHVAVALENARLFDRERQCTRRRSKPWPRSATRSRRFSSSTSCWNTSPSWRGG